MDNNPINDSFEHLEDADSLNVSEQLSASATTQTDKKVVKSTSTKTKTNNDKSILSRLKTWAIDKRYYILAFILPFVIGYIAYALFDAFPAKRDGDNSVLVLDLNGQYVYYFEYFRQALLGDNSIFYSWSRNLSGEFMGIIGYYLASPFTLITVLFPQST